MQELHEVVRIGPTPIGVVSRLMWKIRRLVGRWRWTRRLAAFGARSMIDSPAWIEGGKSIRVGANVKVARFARLEALDAHLGTTRIDIGDDTTIQPFVHIGAVRSVVIGRGCLFASHVYLTDHDHDYRDPMDPVIQNDRVLAAGVTIGDHVWLGERVMVLKGVTIGERSIVGAGSVVTRDIPAFSIAIGSPAQVVRRWNGGAQRWERTDGA